MDLRAGAVLAGKLQLLRVLGQGGMGVVWAARHLTLDAEVAVKVIRPERVAKDPTLLVRFEREARATARISHPHVVKIMDYGVDDDAPYIVMELLGGFSLADMLEQGGRLSLATATALVEQVGAALESAHAHGVVHRDVKPQNVFITEGSRSAPLFVKVLDFGVAKLVGDDVPGGSAALTETGLVVGSAPYMSPEQLEGSKDVDRRSDLWSLAVIAYEALTGALPFRGGSFVTVGAAVLKGVYSPASELQPNLSEAVDAFFARALSVEPSGRYPSAREMVEAFQRLRDAPAGSTTPADGPDHHAPSTDAAARTLDATTQPHAPMAEEPTRFLSAPPRARTAAPHRGRYAALFGVGACALLAGVGFRARSHAAGAGCPPGMSLVTGGAFQLGSPPTGDTPSDETTVGDAPNVVLVKTFCLDTTEVTAGAFAKCTSCAPPAGTVDFEGLTPNGRAFESQFCNPASKADHPMNCVDWYQASDYCSRAGKRLPTEAEWELSARGKERRTYAWGDSKPSGARLNACGAECSHMLTARLEKVAGAAPASPLPLMYPDDDTAEATAPVGHYPAGATPEGVLDLAGNVWEWTASPYCPYPYDDAAACGDSRRVLRGGGWDTTGAQDVRAARRYPSAPGARGKSIGFRCAKNL